LDAAMLGIEQEQTRPRLEQSLEAIVALLRADRPVTVEAEWFKLDEASLQLLPYAREKVDITVAAAVSPSGARLAGKFGTGLLCVAATSQAGFAEVRRHWQIAEEQATLHGTSVERANWRLVGPMRDQLGWPRRDRDAGGRDRADRAPAGRIGRLWHLSAGRPRLGRPRRHGALL
jgi:limonene 1,2-monooxygenase